MEIHNFVSVAASRRFFGMSENELTGRLKDAVAREKNATLQVLEYLSEVNRRQTYVALSYNSLWEYVVEELGYSDTQASERISSMHLLNDVPEAKELLIKGKLSMTTASQVQRFIRNEKRFGSAPLTEAEKRNVVKMCAGLSKREVQKTLFKLQSEEARVESSERMKRINETHTELKFLVPDGVLESLDEVRNLIGEFSLTTVFTHGLALYLKDLKQKKEAALKSGEIATFPGKLEEAKSFSSRSRVIPRVLKRMLYARSGGQCEFIDSNTRNRCLSRHRIEIDHIIPFSAGGKTEIGNLRHLCRSHNQRAAVVWFS
jgi:hypothetical protein